MAIGMATILVFLGAAEMLLDATEMLQKCCGDAVVMPLLRAAAAAGRQAGPKHKFSRAISKYCHLP
jgi:hypothetical protein